MRKQVKDLIKKGKLSEAIDFLAKEARKHGDEEIENQIILLSGQLAKLTRDSNLGLVTRQIAQQGEVRISLSILDIIDDVNWLDKPSTQPEVKKSFDPNQKTVILFLASNPSDMAQLQLEKEFVQISKSLQNNANNFELRAEWAVSGPELQQAILTHKPTIIHFAGHGGWMDTSSNNSPGKPRAAGFFMQDPDNNSAKLVTGNTLAELFGVVKPMIESLDLVVFNSCYSIIQIEAMRKYVSVIGMEGEIQDEAAIEFATGFYLGLTFDPNYENAFNLAKNRINLAGLKGCDLPKLFFKYT